MTTIEIQKAVTRYHFLVNLLAKMTDKTNEALINDKRWFAFGPKVCAKFVSQAKTLMLLFTDKFLEFEDGQTSKHEDISTIYSVIRMQFETHALFYHLFIPSGNWEINILRFRLWELDGIRHRISINPSISSDYAEYKKMVEGAICQLSYYKQLDLKIQTHLMEKAQWRFTARSLSENFRRPISYDQLIKNTQINDSVYSKLYSRFSAYTHPTYSGIIDNYQVTYTEAILENSGAILYASLVTAFLVEDMAKRFGEAKAELIALNPIELGVYESMILYGRYNLSQLASES